VLTATDSSIKANAKLDTVFIKSEIVNGYTITFDKNDSAATGTMANQTINSGDSARLSTNVFVKDGSTFAGWMTSPAGISAAYADGAVYKMGTSSVTLYAKWNRKTTFKLTINATNGSVDKSPNAVSYDSGTVVTLTPVPTGNYHFSGWTGALTGTTNPATIIMNSEKSVTAGFEVNPPNSFSLTVIAENGTVAKSPDATQYDSATVVSLTATPSPGYQFTGWTGDLSGTTNIASITMTGVKSVTANFTIKKYALTVNATNGSVAKSPDANHYDSGTVVSLTATPSPGFQFTGWTGDLSGTTNIASITMTGVKSVTANFTIKKYALTVNATNGSVAKSPDANQYDSGTVVSLTATPSPGFQFTGWTGDLSGTTNIASITMTGAKSITANFAIKKYALTVNATNGTVAKSPDATQYDSTTVVSLTATPSPGYQFTGWTGDLSGTTNPASINMTGAKSVTANFAIKKFALTVNTTNGTVAKSPNATQYDSGTVVSLTATPSPGYQFTGWTADLSGSTNPASINMTEAKSVTANFTIKKYALTVNATNGTVAKSPNATSYDSGTVVSLTATPSPGYQFTGWSGGISGTTNPSSITMNGEKSVTANFGVIVFSVTYNANGGTGTVPVDPGSYTSGSLATVLPNSGKLVKNSESFIGWSNGGIGTIIACGQKIYISGNVTLYAQYSAYEVMDNDGNRYGTVTIGGKTWMDKNLKTTKFDNGDPIPFVEDEGAWKSLTMGAYCWPMNNIANKEYGALYNWYTVNTGNLAPAGWHVATASDWYELVDSLGCDSIACKIKETGETHWASPNECATNSSYFYALGNGSRGRLGLGEDAGFQGFKEFATWWTSTKYFVPSSNYGYLFFIMNSLTENCSKNDFTDATVGYGVRCVKDE
jgi:uncharacterized protein (TIGR02145 family)/uncharacterized repeat protein (TIGR02543 family)